MQPCLKKIKKRKLAILYRKLKVVLRFLSPKRESSALSIPRILTLKIQGPSQTQRGGCPSGRGSDTRSMQRRRDST